MGRLHPCSSSLSIVSSYVASSDISSRPVVFESDDIAHIVALVASRGFMLGRLPDSLRNERINTYPLLSGFIERFDPVYWI